MTSKYYRTKDFGIASILSYLYDLKKIEVNEMNDKQVAVFCFDNTDELNETLKLYWNRQLRVEPLEFAETASNLKKRMYLEINSQKLGK